MGKDSSCPLTQSRSLAEGTDNGADLAGAGGSGDVAGDPVIPRSLALQRLSFKFGFESIDADAQAFQVYTAIVASLKLANRRQQSREGCAPFPQHVNSIPNICLESIR